jgi:hypothetical protein
MSEQPDLFSVADDDALTYAGTAGFVSQPASAQRAQNEARSGEATARARAVLAHLEAHPTGLTWKELATLMNLHHGQISGALSNLHKSGHVFMLHTQRNRCHPYCHAKHRVNYPPAARIDEPAQTKAGKRKDDLEHLLILVQTGIKMGRINDSEVTKLVNQLHSDT